VSAQEDISKKEALLCLRCDLPMEMGKIGISYMGNSFPVDLPRCPGCGQVYVQEELALGRMAEVEKLLEDK
jgi:hypothetical protein